MPSKTKNMIASWPIRIVAVSTMLIFTSIAFACTIGVISGDITNDGRPIIFKNRGINSWNIEFKTVEPADGFRYCGNFYVGQDIAWVGVNEAGFGIVQSAVLNISIAGDENGSFMTEALKRCITVEDFADMVDSSDAAGRSTRANYGVVDFLGNIAMFECGHGESQRYDPDTSGFIIRSNFAFIEDMVSGTGLERYERAMELMFQAKALDSINVGYIARNIMGDLYRNGQNPYPLPFTERFGDLDTGWVDTDSASNRTLSSHRTTSAAIIRCILPDESPELSMMYCYFGAPPVGIPFLLTPKTPDTPPYITGTTSLLRLRAEEVWDSVYHDPDYTLLDTKILLDEYYNGVWEFSLPVIEWVYDTTEAEYESWLSDSPTEAEVTEFQDTIVSRVFNAYSDIQEALTIREELTILEDESIGLYPNPFKRRIFIDVTKSPELFDNVSIYDTTGRNIYRYKIRPSSSIIIWRPKDTLPSGIYFVELEMRDRQKKSESYRILYMK